MTLTIDSSKQPYFQSSLMEGQEEEFHYNICVLTSNGSVINAQNLPLEFVENWSKAM